MSLNNRISITLILFSLVTSGVYYAYTFFDKPSKNAQEQTFSGNDTLSVFENKVVDQEEPQAKMDIQLKEPDIIPAKTTSTNMVKPFFDNGSGNSQQAQSGMQSFPAAQPNAQSGAAQDQEMNQKLLKYSQQPIMQSFTKDLKAALGPDATFRDVLRPDFDSKNAGNPKVQQVLMKYAANPQFNSLMKQMMQDKDFMASFQEQIRNTAAQNMTR